MIARRHSNPAEFRDLVLPFLLEDEVGNCMSIGLLDDSSALRCTAWENDHLRAVLLQTPGRSAMISTGPADAGHAFASEIFSHPTLTGVYGPPDTARSFCSTFTALTHRATTLHLQLAIHRLEKVIPPRPAPGEFSKPLPSDSPTLTQWVSDFARSINEETRDPASHLQSMLARDRLYLWRHNNHPVAMAATAGPTPRGIRINSVYTPPQHRNHGFASSLVASLSQHMLHAGKHFCFLNTDLANPTSNSIYRKIGYTRYADRESYNFS